MNINPTCQHWTPFDANDSKTWPPCDGEYEVTKRYRLPWVELHVQIARFTRWGSDDFSWDTSDVIAWMPRPAPYQPL